MSDLLNIGASGVSAYGKALGTVADNIANANTPGYARRTVQLTTQGVSGSQSITDRGTVSGAGVAVRGVARSTDAFRIADAQLTAADAASAGARSTWLAAAEAALPDGDAGIGASLGAVYAAGDALAADPDGSVPRQAFLGTIDRAASAMRGGADGLARVADGIATDAAGSVAALNGALTSLVKINQALLRAQPGTSGAATLADARDAALDTIAQAAGVGVTLDAHGAATVTLTGSQTVLADVRGAATVQLTQGADGRIALLTDGAAGPVAVQPVTGALSGLIDAAATVAGRRRQLDGIAEDFAAKLNGWSAAGTDAAGAPGTALLAAGLGAAGIRLLTGDPAKVAAANGDAANGNALALAAQRGGGVEARAAALVSGLAQSVAAAKAESGAASGRADAAAIAREDASGVDLDREAADLLRFQQAYGGAAKVIQVARETLQSILSLF